MVSDWLFSVRSESYVYKLLIMLNKTLSSTNRHTNRNNNFKKIYNNSVYVIRRCTFSCMNKHKRSDNYFQRGAEVKILHQEFKLRIGIGI